MTTRRCFVISPIGEVSTDVRRRADGILNEIIRSAFEDSGGTADSAAAYRVDRADEDATPGAITYAVIEKILDADLVVADLTGLNPNVMWELAIRHATGKPVIQMMERGNKLPFDIQAENTIFFVNELIGRSETISALRAAERAVRDNPRVGNPVTRAVDFKGLKSSQDSDTRQVANLLADLQTQVTDLRAEVAHSAVRPLFEYITPRQVQEILESDSRVQQAGISVERVDVSIGSLNVRATVDGLPFLADVARDRSAPAPVAKLTDGLVKEMLKMAAAVRAIRQKSEGLS